MNANRVEAEKAYKAALAAVKKAELGTDLAAYGAADAKLSIARTAAIAAGNAYPTRDEVRRSSEYRRLRNRGYDC